MRHYMTKKIIADGVVKSAIISLTIDNLPEDIDLKIKVIIQQDNSSIIITGDVPKIVAMRMTQKPFFKRIFSEEKYYYTRRSRYFTVHSPNGLPFNCQWVIEESIKS